MPIKFSELQLKPITEAKQVVGLFADATSTTGSTNCIVNVADFATSANLTSNVSTLSAQITENDNKAVHNVYDENVNGKKTFTETVLCNKEFISKAANPHGQFRAIGGNYGFFIRNDGTNTYFLLTNSGDQYGTWTAARPLTINNSTGDVTTSTKWNFSQTINGTAYRAQWGDLAEYYLTDNQYPKGTLVQFGGEKEITIATTDVNAVITSEPGFILNTSMESSQAIALVGRVPVRVIGKVSKFDYLMLSDIPGVAIKKDENAKGNIIARVLEDKVTEEEGLVLCATKFEL